MTLPVILSLIESILSLLSADPASMDAYARNLHLLIKILDSQPDLIQRQYTCLTNARDMVQARTRGETGEYPQDEVHWLFAFCWNKGLGLMK